MSKFRQILRSRITFFIIGVLCLLSAAGITLAVALNPNIRAIKNTDTTSFVKVNELWDSNNIKFNKDNVTTLLQKLTSDGSGSLATLDTEVTSANKTAATLRGYNDSKSVVVRLGGLDWIVTYVSKDTSGNVIATLWLSNNHQEAWSGRKKSIGKYYGFANGGLYADWSADWSDSSDGSYPSNMYGTSYMRAVVLNNGGNYATSTSATTYASFDTGYGAKNPFKDFTTAVSGSNNDLTDFIVKPNNVSWQTSGQDLNDAGIKWSTSSGSSGSLKYLNNDSLKTDLNTSGYYRSSSSFIYQNKTSYTAWGNDYLWLPSIAETGYNTTAVGMWGLNASERMNYDGSTGSFSASTLGTAQSNYKTTAYTSSWLRSVYYDNAYISYNLLSSGSGNSYAIVYNSYAVRPALHLNLTSVAEALNSVDELWDSDKVKFNNANVNSLLQKLTDNAGGTVGTLGTNIDNNGNITATTIRNNGNTKVAGVGVKVRLGDLDWYVTYVSKDNDNNVIATLWLASSSDTSTWGNSSSYWGTNNPSSGVPTNMYGTSYIRAKLNNGGKYIKITSNSANPTSVDQDYSPVSNYQYAAFLSGGELNPYIVQPQNVSWQENGQSAQKTIGLGYNLSNENWTDTKSGNTADNRFYSSGYNFAGKTFDGYGNSTWAADYLWLPSITETGYSANKPGMWGLSNVERSNSTESWLRSAGLGSVIGIFRLDPSGSDRGSGVVANSYAVRPALHLNLTSVEEATKNVVDELWDSESAKFNKANANDLIQKLTNSKNGTLANLSATVKNTPLTATTIRDFGETKTAGTTLKVWLGGLSWYVTYVSKDTSGNVIATLWLSDTKQSAWANSSGNIDSLGYATYSSGGINSRWSANWYYNNTSAPGKYPSSMYGTSYMRAVTLNNGGGYATGSNLGGDGVCNDTLTEATQSSSSPFAKFTMSSVAGSLTDYLVTPSQMSWQTETTKSSQSKGCNNESLNYGYTNSSYPAMNYYTNEDVDTDGYQAWGTDYLWLPSYSETGYSDSFTGLWGLSVAERSNSTTYAWSRSAYVRFSYYAYYLYASGSDYNNAYVNDSYAVRPALHLNLTAMIDSFGTEVTLDKNGGTGGTDSVMASFYNDMPFAVAPTKTGYSFGGYFDSLNDGAKYYNADMTSARWWDKIEISATLYAVWIPNKYTISVSVNDSNMGSVVGGGEQDYGSTITLYACANIGYNFQYWIRKSDSAKLTQNTITMVVDTQNESYTAVFAKSTQLNSVCAVEVAEVNSSGQIVTDNTELKCLGTATIMGYSKVNGLDSVHLYTWASSGYKFAYWAVRNNDGTLTILKNSSGTAYNNCCDIPISLVKDKVVIACFIAKTSAVDDTTGNT